MHLYIGPNGPWYLGSWIGISGMEFSVDGAFGVGLSGFLGVWALYKHRRITLRKKTLPDSNNDER